MKQRGAAAWFVCAGLVSVLAVVVVSDPVPLADRAPTSPWRLDLDVPELPRPPAEADGEDDEAGWELPRLLTGAIQALTVGAAVVVALALLGALGRAWQAARAWEPTWLRWRRPPEADDFDVLDDLAAAVVADAVHQRDALLRGAPRNAIVECWTRLERLVADAGSPRHPAETAAEFTARVLALHHVGPGAIGDLADLYREARFSRHPMGEPDRRAAVEALDALHRGLAAEPSPSAPASPR